VINVIDNGTVIGNEKGELDGEKRKNKLLLC
jgi:hypothetical protein